MGKKKVVWKKVEGIVELAPHQSSTRMRNNSNNNHNTNNSNNGHFHHHHHHQNSRSNYHQQQHQQHQQLHNEHQILEPKEPQLPVSTTTLLTKGQMKRLRAVLDERVEIHGRGNFPTIAAKLVDLIRCLRTYLGTAHVDARDTRLNGGAASFVASSDDFSYADLDLIFPVRLIGDEHDEKTVFDAIRDAVFSTIRELMPDNIGKEKFDFETLKDVYIRKMIKVSADGDTWSLFSLNNEYGRCIELKFVSAMRRQFEFSVDSFQIHLDPLLGDDRNGCEEHGKVTIESMYGDVHQAMNHLHERLIDTVKPEEIRGGGLLKYCHLIIRGYKSARPWNVRKLEKYMCSRFFIDFPDVAAQENKLRNYLDSHFGTAFNGATYDQWSSSGSDTDSEASTSQATSSSMLITGQAKYDFLMLLYRVIDESTVCLMAHERHMTLSMIDRVAFQLSMQCFTPSNFSSGSTTPPRTTLFYLPPNSADWIPVV